MRNKKLIPFETIEKAVAGEPEAIDAVLRHYTARIKYLSTYRGPKTVVKDKLCASVLDDCFRLCCWATKRAQSDRPLALSIQYGMLCDRVRFSLDLSALQRR